MATLDAQVGELRGDISGVNRRIDELHRLLMVLIGIAGGGRQFRAWFFSSRQFRAWFFSSSDKL